MNQLVSQAARMRYRSAGAFTCPLVVRAPYGGGVRTPEMHSDSLEGVFLQTPGLKVVIPSNPYDAKGLLASAVADPDPVLFLENIKLYRSFRQETPAEHYAIPLGKANVVQEGADVSIFAYGAMVSRGPGGREEGAAGGLGASCEVIDLRTVWPLDEEAIVTFCGEDRAGHRGSRSATRRWHRRRDHGDHQRKMSLFAAQARRARDRL